MCSGAGTSDTLKYSEHKYFRRMHVQFYGTLQVTFAPCINTMASAQSLRLITRDDIIFDVVADSRLTYDSD